MLSYFSLGGNEQMEREKTRDDVVALLYAAHDEFWSKETFVRLISILASILSFKANANFTGK